MSRSQSLPPATRQPASGPPATGEPVTGPAPPLPLLRLSWDPAPGQAPTLAGDVRARIDATGAAVGTLILDLSAATGITGDEIAALRNLHDHLRRAGTRLKIAVAARPVLDRLHSEGLARHLGTGAIHPTTRAAVLATYAELPGPGLVTAAVRAALTVPPEPLHQPRPAAQHIGPAVQPAVTSPGPPAEAARPPQGALTRHAAPLRLTLATASPPVDGARPLTGWWTVAPANQRKDTHHG